MSVPASPSTEPAGASVPGKVFVLGEYAALAGLPAVVAAVGPRFRLIPAARVPDADYAREDAAFVTRFEPLSPAGRLLDRARAIGVPGVKSFFEGREVFHDPHAGRGGFGASTAQFALVFSRTLAGIPIGPDPSSMNHEPESRSYWESGWVLYREVTSGAAGSAPPSGADLVAQIHGGVVAFEWSQYPRVEALTKLFPWSQLMVFSATEVPNRKVPTHRHLESLDPRSSSFTALMGELEPVLHGGLRAIREGDARALGRVLTEYAECLAARGLEIESARADREVLSALDGVYGVKGTGALLADGVIVAVESHADRTAITRAAADRGLRLITRELSPERGLSLDD